MWYNTEKIKNTCADNNQISLSSITLPREGLILSSELTFEDIEYVNPLWTPLICLEFIGSNRRNHSPCMMDERVSEWKALSIRRNRSGNNGTDDNNNNNSTNEEKVDKNNNSFNIFDEDVKNCVQNATDNDVSKKISIKVYWWNRYSHEISSDPPAAPKPCQGGLLADEMVSL